MKNLQIIALTILFVTTSDKYLYASFVEAPKEKSGSLIEAAGDAASEDEERKKRIEAQEAEFQAQQDAQTTTTTAQTAVTVADNESDTLDIAEFSTNDSSSSLQNSPEDMSLINVSIDMSLDTLSVKSNDFQANNLVNANLDQQTQAAQKTINTQIFKQFIQATINNITTISHSLTLISNPKTTVEIQQNLITNLTKQKCTLALEILRLYYANIDLQYTQPTSYTANNKLIVSKLDQLKQIQSQVTIAQNNVTNSETTANTGLFAE